MTVTAEDNDGSARILHAALLAAIGLGLRAWWVYRYPPIFGGDTVLRLANYKYIILSYQLPLPQAVIHYLHFLTPSTLVVRWVLCLIGSGVGVAFYFLAIHFVSEVTAFLGALLFTLNPFIHPLSTVPYQESLMLTALLVAFAGAFAGQPIVTSIGLGVACLTRYESWLACPIIFAYYLRQRGVTSRHAIEGVALFGWAPIAWILYNGGLTPPGSVAIASHFTVVRLVRWAYVGYVTFLHTPIPVLLLMLLGVAAFLRRGLWHDSRYFWLAGYLGLFLLALLFSAHGTQPDPERRVTDREAHIPLVAAGLLATIGLSVMSRFRVAAAALCAAVSIWMINRYFGAQTSAPAVQISYQAARFLDSAVSQREHVAILAKPIDSVGMYVESLTQARGLEGRRAAIAILNHLETTPPDFQRILVHSRLGKSQLHSYASLIEHGPDGDKVLVPPPAIDNPPVWIARWSDFRSSSPQEEQVAAMVPMAQKRWSMTQGPLSLAIYRLEPAGQPNPNR